MGMVASAGAAPIPPNPAILFGLGESGRKYGDPLYMWQPPGQSAVNHQSQSPALPAWLSQWYPAPAPRHEERVHESPWKDLPTPDISREHVQDFREVLEAQAPEGIVRARDIAEAVQQIRDSENVIAMEHLEDLLHWLSARTISTPARNMVMKLQVEMLQLEHASAEGISGILQIMMSSLNSLHHQKAVVEIVNAVPTKSLRVTVCEAVTRTFALAPAVAKQTQYAATHAGLHHWLTCLRACRSSRQGNYQDDMWQVVHAMLAKNYSPLELAPHLLKLKHEDLARVLLQHWAQQRQSDSRENTTRPRTATAVDHGTSKVFDFRSTVPAVPMSTLVASLEKLLEVRPDGSRVITENRRYRSHALVDLLTVLNKHQLPFGDIAKEIFQLLCHESQPVSMVASVYHTMRKQRALGVDVELARSLVTYFLSHQELKYAYMVFTSVPSLPLQDFPKLASLAARCPDLPSSAIWNILLRRTKQENIDSIASGGNHTHVSPARIEAVHRTADAFASAHHLPWRIAFRRIWECYRFLKERRAPIRSSMARAMVKAAVIRPLQDMRGPSVVNFRYIRSIVSKIEGEHVAEALDRIVYKIYSSTIQPQARAREAARMLRKVFQHSDSRTGASHWKISPWQKTTLGDGKKWRSQEAIDNNTSATSSQRLLPGLEIIDSTTLKSITLSPSTSILAKDDECSASSYRPLLSQMTTKYERSADIRYPIKSVETSPPVAAALSRADDNANVVLPEFEKILDRDPTPATVRNQPREIIDDDQLSPIEDLFTSVISSGASDKLSSQTSDSILACKSTFSQLVDQEVAKRSANHQKRRPNLPNSFAFKRMYPEPSQTSSKSPISAHDAAGERYQQQAGANGPGLDVRHLKHQEIQGKASSQRVDSLRQDPLITRARLPDYLTQSLKVEDLQFSAFAATTMPEILSKPSSGQSIESPFKAAFVPGIRPEIQLRSGSIIEVADQQSTLTRPSVSQPKDSKREHEAVAASDQSFSELPPIPLLNRTRTRRMRAHSNVRNTAALLLSAL